MDKFSAKIGSVTVTVKLGSLEQEQATNFVTKGDIAAPEKAFFKKK